MAESEWRRGDRVTHIELSAGGNACWFALSRGVKLLGRKESLRVSSLRSRFTIGSGLHIGDTDRVGGLVDAA